MDYLRGDGLREVPFVLGAVVSFEQRGRDERFEDEQSSEVHSVRSRKRNRGFSEEDDNEATRQRHVWEESKKRQLQQRQASA